MEETHVPFCVIVSADLADLSYVACGRCERALVEGEELGGHQVATWRPWPCTECQLEDRSAKPFRGIGHKRNFFRLRLWLEVEDGVSSAVAFDKVARAVVGCSADSWRAIAAQHPGVAAAASDALEGTLCAVTLKGKKRGSGVEPRVTALRPLSPSFRTLRAAVAHIMGPEGSA